MGVTQRGRMRRYGPKQHDPAADRSKLQDRRAQDAERRTLHYSQHRHQADAAFLKEDCPITQCYPSATHSAIQPALANSLANVDKARREISMQAPPTTLSDVSGELAVEILQHVPQQQRLTQCALVCCSWASAAALATLHVECKLTAATAPAFQTWLQQHAGQLLTLQLSSRHERLSLCLPMHKLSQLQHLELSRFRLQLSGEGQLPSLQRVQLWFVELAGPSSLLQLTDAPQLTSLVLNHNRFAEPDMGAGSDTEAAVQQLAAAITAMLQRLQRLSVLELPDMPLSHAAVQQLAAMQELRQVSLAHVECMPLSDLQLLPNSITQLCLVNKAYGEPSLPPQLQQFTGLRNLQLEYCLLPPTLLGSVTQLQVLRLESCTLLPFDPEDEFETEGTAALLDVLPKLKHLQDLELCLPYWDTVSTSPQRFAALTASSHLTRLLVGSVPAAPLPKGAVQHMFPSHRQYPGLLQLGISTDATDASKWCIDSANLASIVSCCPDLETLDITHTVQPGADLSVLLQLPGSCAKLDVGGAAFTDAAAAIVAQLTQLRDLGWFYSPELTDVGLQQLTALHRLVKLSVFDCDIFKESVELDWSPDKGSVSQQLAVLCRQSPVLARREQQQKRLVRELRRLA